MGTYYLCVCEETREFIDPSRVGGGACKFSSTFEGPTANIVAFAIMTHWRGKHVRFIGDGESDLFYDVQRSTLDPHKAVPSQRSYVCPRCMTRLQHTRVDPAVVRDGGFFLEIDGQPHTVARCLQYAPPWHDITLLMIGGYNDGAERHERIAFCPADDSARLPGRQPTAPADESPVERLLRERTAEVAQYKSELRDLQRLVLTAWRWLAGRHPTDKSATALQRLRKAETEIATAAEWEEANPEGARLWVSNELDPSGRL